MTKLNRVQFYVLQVFYNTLFRGLELKLYSITILRTVLYGEIIWGADNVHYNRILIKDVFEAFEVNPGDKNWVRRLAQ